MVFNKAILIYNFFLKDGRSWLLLGYTKKKRKKLEGIFVKYFHSFSRGNSWFYNCRCLFVSCSRKIPWFSIHYPTQARWCIHRRQKVLPFYNWNTVFTIVWRSNNEQLSLMSLWVLIKEQLILAGYTENILFWDYFVDMSHIFCFLFRLEVVLQKEGLYCFCVLPRWSGLDAVWHHHAAYSNQLWCHSHRDLSWEMSSCSTWNLKFSSSNRWTPQCAHMHTYPERRSKWKLW